MRNPCKRNWLVVMIADDGRQTVISEHWTKKDGIAETNRETFLTFCGHQFGLRTMPRIRLMTRKEVELGLRGEIH